MRTAMEFPRAVIYRAGRVHLRFLPRRLAASVADSHTRAAHEIP